MTSWICKKLHIRVKTNKNAVFEKELGWICECGLWTSGTDEYHTRIALGQREVSEDKK